MSSLGLRSLLRPEERVEEHDNLQSSQVFIFFDYLLVPPQIHHSVPSERPQNIWQRSPVFCHTGLRMEPSGTCKSAGVPEPSHVPLTSTACFIFKAYTVTEATPSPVSCYAEDLYPLNEVSRSALTEPPAAHTHHICHSVAWLPVATVSKQRSRSRRSDAVFVRGAERAIGLPEC